MIPNLFVSVAGEPKTGKTHFALTFPDPLALFSFDLGAEFVASKFPGKQIDIFKYPVPIIDSVHPKPYAEEFYLQIKDDYEKAVTSGVYNTVVIDTATALWEIVRHAYTEEKNRKQIVKVEYAEPNARMSWFLLQPNVAGVNLVATHYLRDRYIDDKNTGQKEQDGFRRTHGLADLVLTTEMLKSVVKGTIFADRYDRELNGYEFDDPTYDDLVAVHGWSED